MSLDDGARETLPQLRHRVAHFDTHLHNGGL